MEPIRLTQEGVYDPERLGEYDGLDYTVGIYAILDSKHNLTTDKWGSHELLYLGKVYDQTSFERLRQHVRGDAVWRWVQRKLVDGNPRDER